MTSFRSIGQPIISFHFNFCSKNTPVSCYVTSITVILKYKILFILKYLFIFIIVYFFFPFGVREDEYDIMKLSSKPFFHVFFFFDASTFCRRDLTLSSPSMTYYIQLLQILLRSLNSDHSSCIAFSHSRYIGGTIYIPYYYCTLLSSFTKKVCVNQ